MKNCFVCLTALGFAASVWAQAAAPSTVVTNAPVRRSTPNSNDVVYTLGPDSKPRDGVPNGKFTDSFPDFEDYKTQSRSFSAIG